MKIEISIEELNMIEEGLWLYKLERSTSSKAWEGFYHRIVTLQQALEKEAKVLDGHP